MMKKIKIYIFHVALILRFAQSTVEWGEGDETVGVLVNVDSSRLYQTILGFGGAFTDAAG